MSSVLRRVIIAFLFSISYILGYAFFLNHFFESAGFVLYSKNIFFILFSCAISVVPIIFYRGYKAISSILSVFIYVLMYVPTIITFALGLNIPVFHIMCMQFVFCSMMCLFFVADRFVLIRNFDNKKFAFISVRFFLVLTIISTLYVLYIYWGNLAFVTFENVYEHRFANDILGTDVISRYLMSWLSTIFMPICLIYGIMKKRRIYFIVGTVACIVVYMATAAKGALLTPIILFGLFFLFSRYGVDKIYSSLTLLLSLSIIVLLFICPQPGSIVFYIGSLLLWRVIGCGGHLNLWYYDYFSNHPQTHYSHVGLINYFTKSYPYGDIGLGHVVGRHYWSEEMNANANFWATDGIAAYGFVGVIIVSVVFTFVAILLNTITKKFDKKFILLLFIPFVVSLLNTSLFSTMWSGGGIFIILFLLFCKNEFYPKKYIET